MSEQRDRDIILEMLIRTYGEDRVTCYDTGWLDVSVREIHTCYEEGGAKSRDLGFEFDSDGQLLDIVVD